MSSDKERKKLTDKQRAIVDIVVTTVEALVVVVCIVVSVLVWVGASDPMERNLNWFAIQTDSMMGTNADSLDPGDLMFAKKVKSIEDLKVGDVIAFKGDIIDSAGNTVEDQIITHRIVFMDVTQNVIYTQGDNAQYQDRTRKGFEDVIGVYTGKARGLGKVTLWLGGYKKVVTNQEAFDNPDKLGGYGYERSGSTATFLVIIIPLALLFIYNGYVVVKWTMDERAKKIRAAAIAEASQNTQSQEDVKRAALSEYMRANGMSDEQIAAYFAEQDAKSSSVEPDRHSELVEESPVSSTEESPEAEQPTDSDDSEDK